MQALTLGNRVLGIWIVVPAEAVLPPAVSYVDFRAAFSSVTIWSRSFHSQVRFLSCRWSLLEGCH